MLRVSPIKLEGANAFRPYSPPIEKSPVYKAKVSKVKSKFKIKAEEVRAYDTYILQKLTIQNVSGESILRASIAKYYQNEKQKEDMIELDNIKTEYLNSRRVSSR